MREILFRGRRVDNGEWVEFTPLGALFANPLNIEVELNTVGLFTGLTDKNGNKIFEGDILNMHGGCDAMDISEYDMRVKVVYGHKGYGAEIGFTGSYNSGMQIPLMCEGALTVIGNIHDNPELLKESEEGEKHG